MDSFSSSPQVASTLGIGANPDQIAAVAPAILATQTTDDPPPQKKKSETPPLNVREFRAYQLRLPVTAASLITGLVLVLLSPPKIAIDTTLNHALIAIGYFFLVWGVSIRLWSIAYINKRKSIAVVTTGPYSICRNPLYVGTLLIGTAILLIVQSVTLACLTLPIIALYIWGVIPAEEKVLRSRHPIAYEEYSSKVPRWLPRLKISAFEAAPLKWSPSIRKEIECAGWWMVIAIGLQLVCEFRMESWWAHPLNWP